MRGILLKSCVSVVFKVNGEVAWQQIYICNVPRKKSSGRAFGVMPGTGRAAGGTSREIFLGKSQLQRMDSDDSKHVTLVAARTFFHITAASSSLI